MSYMTVDHFRKQNLWQLAVLAFLREKAMHPYVIERLLRQRHKDDLLVLKRGSLYHAIDRLLKLGLIEAEGTARAGRRPERTTYAILPAGRRILTEWIEEMVSTPVRENSQFMAAMSFLVHLSPAAASDMLEQRSQHLHAHIEELEARVASVTGTVARIHLIESEYASAMLRAELVWVRGLADEIRSGRFTWNFASIVLEAHGADSAEAEQELTIRS
jgi:DNA-binding PadR family transcriptional regulator